MTKPRRYGEKSHPATPTQEQTRPISTETSNLYKKYVIFDVSCKNEPWKKRRCKLMTKPRRYGGKSHPATPTQEQTRPISTVTSNLYKTYLVYCFWYLLRKRALTKQNVANWWPNRADIGEMFVVLGLRCLLDCHVLKGFGIYMIGILDRLYWSGNELSSGYARMFTR